MLHKKLHSKLDLIQQSIQNQNESAVNDIAFLSQQLSETTDEVIELKSDVNRLKNLIESYQMSFKGLPTKPKVIYSKQTKVNEAITKVLQMYEDGAKYKDIAAQLDLPIQRVKNYISRYGKPNRIERFPTNQPTVRKGKTVMCPHCLKTGSSLGMGRWHFDKCKYKK